MLRHFDFVARNALRNRRRSILTIISVTVSLCLLGILIAMYHSLFSPDDTSPAQALRLIVHHHDLQRDRCRLHTSKKSRPFPELRPSQPGNGSAGHIKIIAIPRIFSRDVGAESPDFFQSPPRNVGIPDDQRQAFIQLRTGAIAGKPLVDSMGWKLGDTVNLEGDIFPVNLELKLVGIYTDPEKDEVLIFNNEYLQESLTAGGAQRDTTGAFFILADKRPKMRSSCYAREHRCGSSTTWSPAPTKSESEKDFALSFLAFLGNMKMFLAAISGAVMFTILLVSANTVAMTVRERVRETADSPGTVSALPCGDSRPSSGRPAVLLLKSAVGGASGRCRGGVKSLHRYHTTAKRRFGYRSSNFGWAQLFSASPS